MILIKTLVNPFIQLKELQSEIFEVIGCFRSFLNTQFITVRELSIQF